MATACQPSNPDAVTPDTLSCDRAHTRELAAQTRSMPTSFSFFRRPGAGASCRARRAQAPVPLSAEGAFRGLFRWEASAAISCHDLGEGGPSEDISGFLTGEIRHERYTSVFAPDQGESLVPNERKGLDSESPGLPSQRGARLGEGAVVSRLRECRSCEQVSPSHTSVIVSQVGSRPPTGASRR